MQGIPKDVQAEYAARRASAVAARDARADAAYAIAPRLREVALARREVMLELGRVRLKHGDDAPLTAQLDALDAQRTALLQLYNLPADLFALRYACPRCRDTGFTDEAHRVLCGCLKQRLAERGYSQANLHAEERFECFREDIFPDALQRKQTARLRDICLRYAEDFPPGDGKGLLLFGEAGLGKTFLLNCIAHRVIERGYSAVDVTAYHMMKALLQSVQRHTDVEEYLLPDLLIIDDLGSETVLGALGLSHLFSVLNERQSRRKPTLIATNLEPLQIEEIYGERLYSRLFAPRLFSLYQLKGADLRLQNANRTSK